MEMIIFAIFIIILMSKLNRQLIIENLVLRQQLAVMRQSIKNQGYVKETGFSGFYFLVSGKVGKIRLYM